MEFPRSDAKQNRFLQDGCALGPSQNRDSVVNTAAHPRRLSISRIIRNVCSSSILELPICDPVNSLIQWSFELFLPSPKVQISPSLRHLLQNLSNHSPACPSLLLFFGSWTAVL